MSHRQDRQGRFARELAYETMRRGNVRETILNRAESMAHDMGKSRAEQAIDSLCVACQKPPLSKEAARDVPAVCRFEDFCEATGKALPESETWWIFGELEGHYRDGYHSVAVEPDECMFCLHEPECGHTHHGDRCPVSN